MWGLRYNAVNEPINLLSRYVRIRFYDEPPYLRLRLGVQATAVRIFNGNWELAGSLYDLTEDGTCIAFDEAYDPDWRELVVYATLAPSYWHDAAIRSSTLAARYESFSAERLFLFGGENGAELFISRPVDALSDADSKACDGAASTLYFPRGRAVSFGDGQAITAVRRIGDRMMICTANSTWLTDSIGTEEISVRPLSQTMGCRAVEGILPIDGDVPMTLSAGGLFRWHIDTDDWTCTRECISGAVAAPAGDGFFDCARLHYLPSLDRLWVYRPGDGEGRVFIYDCANRRWFSYVGVCADRVFEADGRVGFSNGGELCLFDGALTVDVCSFGEREIVGIFESRRADLGNCEVFKRAVRLFAEADLADGELLVGLYDGGLLDEALFRGSGTHSAHISTSRFRRMSVTLRAFGKGRRYIHRLCVHVV